MLEMLKGRDTLLRQKEANIENLIDQTAEAINDYFKTFKCRSDKAFEDYEFICNYFIDEASRLFKLALEGIKEGIENV